jgi:hypothetical protein
MSRSAAPPIYELHGLRIRSEIPLGEPTLDGRYDLAVSWFPNDAPPHPVERCVLAEALWPGGLGYRHVETSAGFRFEFRGVCNVVVASDRRSLTVALAPGAEPEMIPIFLKGNVLAMLFLLAGESVLHASAAALGGGAVAFVGGSGAGKSTLVTQCCAAGAELITDDVLRVTPDGAGFRCASGGSEVRLRSAASALAALFPGRPSQPTPDGRMAVRLRDAAACSALLAAIVTPVRTRSPRLHVERLAPLAAWQVLIEAPRVLGLRDPGLLHTQFETASRLAQSVPVYRAEIPSGPPFDASVGAELLSGVGLR